MKKACRERLNVVKVISNKSWHLSKTCRKGVYNALVRSLTEYASFIFSTLSQEDKRSLNAIQYNAFRAIYQKDRSYKNRNLLILANETTLEKRLNNLHEKYLCRAISSKNPLVNQMIDEYKSLKQGRFLIHKT